MDLNNLKELYSKINASVNAIKDASNITESDKSLIVSVDNILALIVGLFEKSVNTYYVSNYLSNTNSLFKNINSHISSNIFPYINNESYRPHIKTQIPSLKVYITEAQSIATSLAFLGFPAKHKFINSVTQKQLKETDELLALRYEKIEELNKSISKLDDTFNKKCKDIDSKIYDMESKLTKYSNTHTETLNTRVESIKASIELIKDEFINEKKSLIESVTKELNDKVENAEKIVGLLS